MSDDEARLVRAAQNGDTLAMNELLDRLTGYVSRICGPIALSGADDAAQEALVAIFRALRTLKEPAALYGWARRIAVHEAIRIARRESHSTPAELTVVPAPGDPQLAADIRDVLARLSPEHRAVLTPGISDRTRA